VIGAKGSGLSSNNGAFVVVASFCFEDKPMPTTATPAALAFMNDLLLIFKFSLSFGLST